uniref:Uncharacterized protein n=1 Tax=Lates calcarifer TaxID=8187 RepID=A0A4W6CM34_LATCA
VFFPKLACDFLGERLAGVLGLNAAKYQYAIDQYQSDHKGQADTIHLSHTQTGSHYGATGDARCQAADPKESYDEKQMSRKGGYHNRSYQADEDSLK